MLFLPGQGDAPPPGVELSEDVVEILGTPDTNTVICGPNLHKDLVSRWQKAVAAGLSEEDKKELCNKYPPPENFQYMAAPKLNPTDFQNANEDIPSDSWLFDDENLEERLKASHSLEVSGKTIKPKPAKSVRLSCLRPPLPKYNNTWDPGIVLNYIKNSYSTNPTLEQLTLKTAMLLALATGQRVQTLASMEVCNIQISHIG
ncbi:unnamed protein product [Acanthoscelides obtectus]|uniref:Uncharacterized protein n=1 Tax=Acanthoscelides obtectus TaxID=200917 RepID=A0A9P0L0W1_ACAOB|nr:unnamed protein product [Acanthoscelides obtectus]CAK1650889.1 hypothetical protein AOBTE_LOCUS16947 [Acanthoscelides obtectus]